MEEIVHIIPLGWERSRAIDPLKYVAARRVYLLHRLDHKLTIKFVELVASELQNSGIEVKKIPLTERPDTKFTREFETLLFLVSKIVVEENEKKNRVYLNISAAGKIAAAACFLVGMYHWDKIVAVYYARPAKYTVEEENPTEAFEEWGLSVGVAGIEYLPVFKLGRPRTDALRILAALYERGALSYLDILKLLKEYHDRMRADGAKPADTPFAELDLTKFAELRKRSSVQSELNSWVARLRRYAIDALIQGQYIELKPSHTGPMKLIDLTQHGRYAALLSGFVTKPS